MKVTFPRLKFDTIDKAFYSSPASKSKIRSFTIDAQHRDILPQLMIHTERRQVPYRPRDIESSQNKDSCISPLLLELNKEIDKGKSKPLIRIKKRTAKKLQSLKTLWRQQELISQELFILNVQKDKLSTQIKRVMK